VGPGVAEAMALAEEADGEEERGTPPLPNKPKEEGGRTPWRRSWRGGGRTAAGVLAEEADREEEEVGGEGGAHIPR
jgi:hypothetical protein